MITDRINADERLAGVRITDEEAQAFLTREVTPVLATPAVVTGVLAVTAGAAYGQAVD